MYCSSTVQSTRTVTTWPLSVPCSQLVCMFNNCTLTLEINVNTEKVRSGNPVLQLQLWILKTLPVH